MSACFPIQFVLTLCYPRDEAKPNLFMQNTYHFFVFSQGVRKMAKGEQDCFLFQQQGLLNELAKQ